jgi:glucan 1,3-beta-glucosidase
VASFDAALPRPPFFSMGGNDFRHPSLRGSIVSSLPGTPGPGSNGSLQALHEPHAAAGLDEVQAFASEEHGGLRSTNLSEKHVRGNAGAKKRWILGGVTALVVVLGVSIPLAVLLSGRHSSSAESPSAASAAPDNSPTTALTAAPSTGGTKPQLSLAVTGGDGSTITIDDGTNFTYTNKFGGFWYFDSEDVFKNAAKCNSWTPALNETFQFGSDRIFGVNLGGWLTTEPVRPSIRVLSSVSMGTLQFISPALYEKYINHTSSVVDEWTLSQAMTKDTAGNGPSQLEDHYKTFIVSSPAAPLDTSLKRLRRRSETSRK